MKILKMKSEQFNHHEIIKTLITSKDFQTRRNGLIFLVNFSKLESFCSVIIKYHLESLITILADTPALKNRDIKRQTVQCLSNLAKSNSKDFPSLLQSQLKDALDLCQHQLGDEVLSQSAMDVLASLGSDST